MPGLEGVLAHRQPDTSPVILYALNSLLLRGRCVVRLNVIIGHMCYAPESEKMTILLYRHDLVCFRS